MTAISALDGLLVVAAGKSVEVHEWVRLHSVDAGTTKHSVHTGTTVVHKFEKLTLAHNAALYFLYKGCCLSSVRKVAACDGAPSMTRRSSPPR